MSNKYQSVKAPRRSTISQMDRTMGRMNHYLPGEASYAPQKVPPGSVVDCFKSQKRIASVGIKKWFETGAYTPH